VSAGSYLFIVDGHLFECIPNGFISVGKTGDFNNFSIIGEEVLVDFICVRFEKITVPGDASAAKDIFINFGRITPRCYFVVSKPSLPNWLSCPENSMRNTRLSTPSSTR